MQLLASASSRSIRCTALVEAPVRSGERYRHRPTRGGIQGSIAATLRLAREEAEAATEKARAALGEERAAREKAGVGWHVDRAPSSIGQRVKALTAQTEPTTRLERAAEAGEVHGARGDPRAGCGRVRRVDRLQDATGSHGAWPCAFGIGERRANCARHLHRRRQTPSPRRPGRRPPTRLQQLSP